MDLPVMLSRPLSPMRGKELKKWLETGGLAKRFAGFGYFSVYLSKIWGSPTSKKLNINKMNMAHFRIFEL
jgi:hypothetical protein